MSSSEVRRKLAIAIVVETQCVIPVLPARCPLPYIDQLSNTGIQDPLASCVSASEGYIEGLQTQNHDGDECARDAT